MKALPEPFTQDQLRTVAQIANIPVQAVCYQTGIEHEYQGHVWNPAKFSYQAFLVLENVLHHYTITRRADVTIIEGWRKTEIDYRPQSSFTRNGNPLEAFCHAVVKLALSLPEARNKKYSNTLSPPEK